MIFNNSIISILESAIYVFVSVLQIVFKFLYDIQNIHTGVDWRIGKLIAFLIIRIFVGAN